METVFAAADLGRTILSAGLGTATGGLFDAISAGATRRGGAEGSLSLAGSLLESLIRRSGRIPAALGLAMPAPVDPAHGAFLGRRLGVPVRARERYRCAPLGELHFGHGQEYSSLLYHSLVGEIGGGIVIDGRSRLGPLGAAGELGNQIVLPGEPLCARGNPGYPNAIASAPTIANTAGHLEADAAANAARDGMNGRVWRSLPSAAYLGLAGANRLTALRPAAVLFSRRIAGLADLLLVPVRAAINENVRSFPAQDVAVRRAGAGPETALPGALVSNAVPDKLAV